MKATDIRAATAAAALCLAAPAQATVVYDSGVEYGDMTIGITSNSNHTAHADDFLLTSSAMVDTLRLSGKNNSGETVQGFVINFHRDISGAPTRIADVSRNSADFTVAETGAFWGGGPILEYEVAFDPVSLEAGDWWISAYAVLPESTSWYWLGVQTGSPYTSRWAGSEDPWNISETSESTLDFALLDLDRAVAVPVPAALPLLAAALAGLGFAARRRS